MTQEEMAGKLALSEEFVRRLESGIQDCRVTTAKDIARRLKVNLDDLAAVPTEARLAEIRLAWLERETADARATVAENRTGGGA